ncbi:MAG: hypothetical protein ABIE22_01070 [archaeon]
MEARVKINKKALLSEKAGMSYFQIVVLVMGIFAFCYIVYSVSKEVEVVEAQPLTPTCCEKSLNGTICQEMLWDDCRLECEGAEAGCFPGFCDDFTNCDMGCCFDSEQGTCASNSPKALCEDSGGEWSDDIACNIRDCQKGCCVLGSETQFVTETRCEYLADWYGYDVDFRGDVNYELNCIALAATTEKGACVYEGAEKNDCLFISEVECINSHGNFHAGALCSHPDLNTNCTKQETTGCVNGRDEVYWFDSCNNPENIYDSNKDRSWNNGWVLSKNESCNLDLENGNALSPDCGNCFYLLGSICGKSEGSGVSASEGDYICRDMDCIDEKGNPRRNGESWCVYDGWTGPSGVASGEVPNVAAAQIIPEGGRGFSTDPVGSRHWKRYCIDGEVKVDPCGDYRSEICVQSEIIVDNATNEKFTTSSCIINPWQECLSYNIDGETEKCGENYACRVQEVDIDGDSFDFDVCVPKYPTGFDVTTDGGYGSASRICDTATLECTYIEVKDYDGDWNCEFNCDCKSAEFTQKMNEFCVSLGDCGAYVNIEGEVTDGGYTTAGGNTQPQRLTDSLLSSFAEYARPVEGKFIDAKDISDWYGFLGIGEVGGAGNYEIADYSDTLAAFIGGTAGAGGVVMALDWVLGGTIAAETSIYTPIMSSQLVAFANVAVGAAVGGLVAMLVGSMFGLQGDAMIILTIVGMVTMGAAVWATLAVSQGAQGLGACLAGGPFCLIALAIIIIVAVILEWLGIGDTREKTVQFHCLPWEAPVGGADCEKCDDDLMKPCSRYRCNSLGAACKFFNEGSEEEMCIASEDDGISPVISPWYDAVTENYTYTEVNRNGYKVRQTNGECIQAYKTFQIGISTDEISQCKVDYEHTSTYENMADYFGGKNYYVFNHSMSVNLPSPDALGAHGFDPARVADMDIYVRCQDDWGYWTVDEYTINLCVRPGPDLTAPQITKTIPEDYAYVKFNATEKNITIYVDEPVECRWSKENKDYDLMENNFQCTGGFEYPSVWGFDCKTTLSLNNTVAENEFFFRCKDQPWWAGTENETNRNKNVESYPYSLYPSLSPLRVIGMYPEGEATFGDEPVTIELEAYTAGGAEDGKAICEWKINRWGDRFRRTNSASHSSTLTTMFAGDYDYSVSCKDAAENEAEAETEFKINIDNKYPKVIRVYHSGGSLVVETEEDSECAYSTETCYFSFEDGQRMSAFGRTHTTPWQKDFTYHVKCRDLWENTPGGCSIKVRAVDLG